MSKLTAQMTPAEEGIKAAKKDARKYFEDRGLIKEDLVARSKVRELEAKAKAAAEALDDDGYPTWEKIANVHRKASEARLAQIRSLESQLRAAREEIETLEIELFNAGIEKEI